MTDEEKAINLLKYVTLHGEGALYEDNGVIKIDYGLLEYGALHGIGILQWTFTRSFTLIRAMFEKNGWLGTTPPSEVKQLIEANKPWSDYFWSSNEEQTWLIGTTLKGGTTVRSGGYIGRQENRTIQDSTSYTDLLSQYNLIRSMGVTNIKTIAFMSDIMNAYGTGAFSGDCSPYNDWNYAKSEFMRIFGVDRVGHDYRQRFNWLITACDNYDLNNPQPNLLGDTSNLPNGGEPSNGGNSLNPTNNPNQGQKQEPNYYAIDQKYKEKIEGNLYPNQISNSYLINPSVVVNKLYGNQFKISLKDVEKPQDQTPPPTTPVPEPTNPKDPPSAGGDVPAGWRNEAIGSLRALVLNGSGYNVGGYGYQCVSLISGTYGSYAPNGLGVINQTFNSYCPYTGGAKDLGVKDQANWHRIPFSQRQAGDIIVWSNASWGHIAIVGEDLNCVYEQNTGGGSPYNIASAGARYNNAGYDPDGTGSRSALGIYEPVTVWTMN